MARYCPLFSGSGGNCTYLGTAHGGILVDAGVSAKRIKTALVDRGVDPQTLHGIFITHEHSDHISGLRVFLKQYPMPVFATRGTLEAIIDKGAVPENATVIVIDRDTAVGDLTVSPFLTPHDSAQSCGYRVMFPDERIAVVATDIGFVSDEVRRAVTGCDLVHIESNHDVRMLENGPYPYMLKCRILGRGGHLSNDSCASLLPRLLESGATRFVLSHLSRENNLPQLAQQTAQCALSRGGAREGQDYLLSVAKPQDDAPVMLF